MKSLLFLRPFYGMLCHLWSGKHVSFSFFDEVPICVA